MKTKRVPERTDLEIELARRLSDVRSITEFDGGEHKEAWALAHALHEFESTSQAMQELVAKLRSPGISDDEIKDILLDIGEELREILWHVNHLGFYDYLVERDSLEPRS